MGIFTPEAGADNGRGQVYPRTLDPYALPGVEVNPFWSVQRGREVGDEKIRLKILKEAEASFAKEIKRLAEDASSYASAASAAAAEQAKKEAGVSVGEPAGGPGPPGQGGGLDRPPGLPMERAAEPIGVTVPEAVRSLELPALPSPSSGDASIQFGDWLIVVHPLMSDLSGSAQQWWDQAIKEAELLYDKRLSSSPLMRLRIKSELPVPDKFKRVESSGGFPCCWRRCPQTSGEMSSQPGRCPWCRSSSSCGRFINEEVRLSGLRS